MKNIIVATLVMLAPLPALACSCAPAGPDAPVANTIVEGRVTAVSPDSAGKPEMAAVLMVTRTIKGTAAARIIVRTSSNPATCGVTFRVGQTVRVAMNRAPQGYTTNLCLNLRDQQSRQPKS